MENNRANHDCLKIFNTHVTGAKVIDAAELLAIDTSVLALIDEAVVKAKAAPLPTLADLTTDVYVSY